MKKLFFIAILATFTLVYLSGCNEKNDDPGNVSGEQSTIGDVGNTFTMSTMSEISDAEGSVTELKDGVSTVSVSGTVIDESFKQLAELIPNFAFGTYDKTTGQFSGELKMKFTKDGIVDYLNSEERPFVIARFDADVGDTYSVEKVNGGGSFTRTVTARSDEDDFPYGFYYIKTITVEEPGRNPAISKVKYRLNHRFGLVHVTLVMQDKSEISSYLYSFAEND